MKARIQKFSKLIEISCLQVMKSKLTIIPSYLTCFIQTFQLCIPTIVEVSLQRFFCGCCSLLIFVAQKATKGTELQFLCTQGTLQGGRVEDHRIMFIMHLHLTQLYIQAIIYTYCQCSGHGFNFHTALNNFSGL